MTEDICSDEVLDDALFDVDFEKHAEDGTPVYILQHISAPADK